MQTVNIHKAQTQLSRLVDQVSAGEEIVIARTGRPVARLVSLAPKKMRTPGIAHGQLQVPDTFGQAHARIIADMFEGRDTPERIETKVR